MASGRPKKKSESAEPETPVVLSELYKPDDLVWVKLKGYPWWPCRVYDEEQVPEKVKKQKHKATSIPVHFLESDLFYWPGPKEIIKFRSEKFEELSSQTKRSNEWKKAFKLCQEFEKGEYKPPPVTEPVSDSSDESEEDVSTKKTGKKRGRPSGAKEPDSKKQKTETGTKRGRPPKSPAKSDAKSPAKSKTPTKAPASPRKSSKAGRIKLSKEAIKDIADKLQIAMKREDIDTKEIYTLLDILSKIEVTNVEVLRSVSSALIFLKELRDHENKDISQLATEIFNDFKRIVSAHKQKNYGSKSSSKNTSSSSRKSIKSDSKKTKSSDKEADSSDPMDTSDSTKSETTATGEGKPSEKEDSSDVDAAKEDETNTDDKSNAEGDTKAEPKVNEESTKKTDDDKSSLKDDAKAVPDAAESTNDSEQPAANEVDGQ